MGIKFKILSYLSAVTFILLIIIFPEVSSKGVASGLVVSAGVVIPSLFPFMVCVLMIINNGFNIKSRFLNICLFKIFGQNSEIFIVFIMSLIGGYPVGAKLINELHCKRLIDNKTANIMLMYCVNAGPAFIISIVGIGVFKSRILGVVIMLSHILGSLIIALLCSKHLKKINSNPKCLPVTSKTFSEIFVKSVSDASESILQICSFVILFSCINAYLELFFGNSPIIKYISFFTEVTSAVNKTNNIFLISFLLGFSGFSIWCQIFSLSSSYKINLISFIFGRVLHGTISTLLIKTFTSVFKISITTFNNGITAIKDLFYTDITVSFSLAIMIIVLLIFIYSKNNSGKLLKDVI